MAANLARKVSARVSELQTAVAEKVCIQKAEIVSILADGIRRADLSKMSPTAAADLLAKLLGWYAPEKQEVEVRYPPDEELLKKIMEARRSEVISNSGLRAREEIHDTTEFTA
jgi:hypothetical protein